MEWIENELGKWGSKETIHCKVEIARGKRRKRVLYREHFADVVTDGTDGIHVLVCQNPHQTRSVRFQDPLGHGLEFTLLRDDHLLFVLHSLKGQERRKKFKNKISIHVFIVWLIVWLCSRFDGKTNKDRPYARLIDWLDHHSSSLWQRIRIPSRQI